MPMLDADIHPSATGPAADIVAKHPPNRKVPLVLYSGWFCPFVQRSWITLEELGLDYEYVEINPYKKEASFLALNPRGLVPTLGCPMPPDGQQGGGEGKMGDDGITRKPLIESNVICEYLDMYAQEEQTGGSKKSLFPKDLYERARLRVWIDFVGSRIIPAFHRLLQHTPEAAYSLESALEEIRGHLRTWIKEADPKGPYFGRASNGNDGFNMADVALAPWAVRLWVSDYYKGAKLVPEKGAKEDDEIWERFRQWMTAIEERPSVKNTLSDNKHYLPIYQRYADNKAESELAKATRHGRGVP